MKFVHTFWSKPLLFDKFSNKRDSVHYTLVDYACSAAYIHHLGYEIVLFTDEIGKELLYFIPYDDIFVINDMRDLSQHFAAKMKFDALKHMDVGDVLIDGDLFIRERSTCDMIRDYKEDVIYSFYEPHSFVSQEGVKIPHYRELIDKLSVIKLDNPYHLPPITNLSWPNTSLLKINNREIKEEYIRQYEHHVSQVSRREEFGNAWPDVILEQYFLGCLLESGGCTHRPVIPDFPTPSSNDYALSIKFTHLGSRKNLYNSLVETWLKEVDKELYGVAMKMIDSYI